MIKWAPRTKRRIITKSNQHHGKGPRKTNRTNTLPAMTVNQPPFVSTVYGTLLTPSGSFTS